jgi:hypothetical protein
MAAAAGQFQYPYGISLGCQAVEAGMYDRNGEWNY